ncbi:YtrH family sporulation protein [Bacillus sp. 2205SS5-2]|uniref:YtrH family sporulation protein n=1 Tax=Bacillus sp. 2205SS5-2 TaxID=3109031 RepID=UPI0030051565
MSEAFFPEFFKSFFIAFGVILGGSFLGAFSYFLMGQPPLTEMERLSKILRIWAIIAAIGGTFDTVYSFERGFMDGETKDLLKQFFFILSALGGAQAGIKIIEWFTQEHIS